MAVADRFIERLTASCNKCGWTAEEDFLVIDPHVPRPSHLRTRAEQAEYERSRTTQRHQPWRALRGNGFRERQLRLILLHLLMLGSSFVGVRLGYLTVYGAAGAFVFSALIGAFSILLGELNR